MKFKIAVALSVIIATSSAVEAINVARDWISSVKYSHNLHDKKLSGVYLGIAT